MLLKRILGFLILILCFAASAHAQLIIRFQNSTTTLAQVSGGQTTIRCDGTTVTCTYSGGVFTLTAVGGAPSGAAGGDLSGTYPNPGVAKINGTSFAGTNGHLVSFGAANIPADSGVVAANAVVASSPGAGVAHFAGSTQTATSSAVVSADLNITTTTCTNQVVSAISAGAVGTCHTVVGADMASATVTATQLAAQYSKGSCTELWGGSGAAFALTSGDDAISNNSCYNDSGVTRTITAVKCRSDNGSNTTTVNPTFGSAGTGTTILSGALTCGSSLSYSSTGTVSNASWTTGTGINPVMAGTLTGTSIAVIIEYTY